MGRGRWEGEGAWEVGRETPHVPHTPFAQLADSSQRFRLLPLNALTGLVSDQLEARGVFHSPLPAPRRTKTSTYYPTYLIDTLLARGLNRLICTKTKKPHSTAAWKSPRDQNVRRRRCRQSGTLSKTRP